MKTIFVKDHFQIFFCFLILSKKLDFQHCLSLFLENFNFFLTSSSMNWRKTEEHRQSEAFDSLYLEHIVNTKWLSFVFQTSPDPFLGHFRRKKILAKKVFKKFTITFLAQKSILPYRAQKKIIASFAVMFWRPENKCLGPNWLHLAKKCPPGWN